MKPFRYTEQFYYSRKPTEAAPCTILVGPFASNAEARQHLLSDIKRTEDDLAVPNQWGAYQILQVVATVRPTVTHNVQLKTL